ncbi:MAG: hypothetical protein DDT33_01405 [Firmicutes bacterium]|nr:MAG: DUF86 domain-containing protein [Methanosarcinales archaeon Met12]MBT9132875.1 hypothetical protein [Bacillota bacterium]
MDEKEKISLKLRSMKKYVNFLSSKRNVLMEELEGNYELRSAIERNFQLAIESTLDIGEIIISVEGFEKPEDYKSVILILGKHDILPEDFAEEFALAAGFRNVLVHMYEEVDMGILHDFLHNKLDDFDTFAKFMVEYIRSK